MAERVVWILGAGASVGLGGPTLASLLSKASKLDLEARYEGQCPKLFAPAAYQAHRLYHHGRRWPEGWVHPNDKGKPGELLWRDAEEFLDYLDTAAADANGATAKRLQLTMSRFLKIDGQSNSNDLSAQTLSVAARRLVAGECCAFLENADMNSERWAPYLRWASSLGENDAIVTFNYDRVLEMINPSQMAVICSQADIAEAARCRQGFILKLHGSVDWRQKDGVIEHTKDPTFALRCLDEELAVATPGPTKAKHSKIKAFAELWALAESKIAQADNVVFVGYRFPPTDSIARERLLRAVVTSDAPLRCRIVLGHFAQSRVDAARVQAMLEFARDRRASRARDAGAFPTPKFEVYEHPMLAEDFFAVINRNQL